MKKSEWHTSYVQRSFFLNDYAKEMRLTDMPAKMLDDYTVTLRDFTRLKRRYGRRLFLSLIHISATAGNRFGVRSAWHLAGYADRQPLLRQLRTL